MASKPRPARNRGGGLILSSGMTLKNEDSLLYPLIESSDEEAEEGSELDPSAADIANLDAISNSSSVSGKSDEDTAYSTESSAASYASVKVQQTKFQKIKTAAVYIGLTGGVAASALACIASPVVMVFVMAGVCVANAPYSAFKEHRIVKLPALRSLNNRLREAANNLESEIDVLSDEIDTLEPEVSRVKDIEADLRAIAEEQKFNVDKLVDLVKENERILEQMKDNLRHRIMQDILRIVVMSDTNNDGVYNKVECKMLVLKIRMTLQEVRAKSLTVSCVSRHPQHNSYNSRKYGVEFDENKASLLAVRPTLFCVSNLSCRSKVYGASNEKSDCVASAAYESNGSSKEDDDSSVDSDSDDIYDMFHVDLGGSEGIDGDLTGLGRSMSGSSAGSANGTRLSLSFAKKSSEKRPSASPRKRRPSSGRRHQLA
ncbi:hypothetical protein THAOC_19933 [Thalassiosira oceanica]|uniref:Uncharacterized protein n=1 Tax=Thalassiosira oceanica TaxID=159749 RepID=K0SFU9_THAOC|nr:hypothetical protein THAOC_19933 [Thalassiosira oceanica]|eukprot:EJK59801.1 hypothetical protein THAOC_19933 [Thalassiosira oceanica]